MKILVCDTETTGFILKDRPPSDPGQPHLVQIAALLIETATWKEHATLNLLVAPDGYTIPEQAAKAHGVTTETATRYGVSLRTAIAMFCNLRRHADCIIAHNMDFDRVVLDAAIHRSGATPSNPGPNRDQYLCTMRLATDIVGIPPTLKMIAAGIDRNKAPSVTECMKFFFDEDFSPYAHDALNDARACARIYRAIVEQQNKETAA